MPALNRVPISLAEMLRAADLSVARARSKVAADRQAMAQSRGQAPLKVADLLAARALAVVVYCKVAARALVGPPYKVVVDHYRVLVCCKAVVRFKVPARFKGRGHYLAPVRFKVPVRFSVPVRFRVRVRFRVATARLSVSARSRARLR